MSANDNDKVKSMRDAYSQLKIYSDIGNTNSSTQNSIRSVDSGNNLQSIMSHSGNSSRRPSLIPSVSFNTVPLLSSNSDIETEEPEFLGVQIPDTYSMDEYYDDESYASESNKSFRGDEYITSSSRSPSPPPKWSSHKSKMTASNLAHHLKIAENGRIVRTDYPSRPSIETDAVIINREQNSFKKAWRIRKAKINERINNKETYFLKPRILLPEQKYTMPIMDEDYTPITKEQRKKDRILQKKIGFTNVPRTVVCHISGRKHTWVALDWAMTQLVSDTDHLVIIANLPKKKVLGGNPADKFNKFTGWVAPDNASLHSKDTRKDLISLFSNRSVSDEAEWCYGYDKLDIERSIRDIFSYVRAVISPSISLKITVEIVVSKTSTTLINMFKSYNPDFIVSSTKKHQYTENMVVWKSRNLSDQLATNYLVPVFIVPSLRMYEFERSLQTASSHPLKNNSKLRLVVGSAVTKTEDKSNTEDTITNRIRNEITSVSMEKHLQDISKDNRTFMLIDLKKCESSNHNNKLCKINIIFKSSVSFAQSIAKIKVDSNKLTEFEQWKRDITGGEVKPTTSSKKSMLDVVKTTSNKSPKLHHTHSHTPLTRTVSHIPNLTHTMSSIDDISLGPSNLSSIDSKLENTHPTQRRHKHDRPDLSLRKVVSNVERVSSTAAPKKKSGGFFSSLFKK